MKLDLSLTPNTEVGDTCSPESGVKRFCSVREDLESTALGPALSSENRSIRIKEWST